MIPIHGRVVLHRHYPVSPEKIWRLWATADGISAWWAPTGFSISVDVLDLRPGGALVYTMTATGRPEIAFMQSAGIALSTTSCKTYTVVEEAKRLGYTSLIDFVPGVAPYECRTVVTLERTASGTDVTMEIDPIHDEVAAAHI